MLSTPDAIRQRFANDGAVLIGMDGRAPERDGVRRELFDALTRGAEEMCRGQCGPMLLFYWRFDEMDRRN